MIESRLYKHHQQIIQYDLLYKRPITKNFFNQLNLKKIILHSSLNVKDMENKKKMISLLLLLELISFQKPLLTKSKKNNIIIKMKKGMIVGCKVTLRKKYMYNLLENLFLFVLPRREYFNGFFISKEKNIVNFKIYNLLDFFLIENEFLKFQQNPPIDISIQTNSLNNKECSLLLNSFGFYINKNNF